MPVQVVLEESDMSRYCENYQGTRCYFVVIEGVPHSKGMVVTNAYPLPKAEKIKAAVEASLREYAYEKRSKPKPAKPVRTRYARVR